MASAKMAGWLCEQAMGNYVCTEWASYLQRPRQVLGFDPHAMQVAGARGVHHPKVAVAVALGVVIDV